jgi:hypothetical protein
MQIKIWANDNPDFSDVGPYRMLDILKRDAVYLVGDHTHYGPVIAIPPPVEPFTGDADQSVIVKLDTDSLATRPDESTLKQSLSLCSNIGFFPIFVDRHLNPEPPDGPSTILAAENLTVEDVSPLITSTTFSTWKYDCFLSKENIRALEGVKYALVHRYQSDQSRDAKLDQHSDEIVNLSVACLSLIRPTRRSRAGKITGTMSLDGKFEPQRFNTHVPAEVPEVQKLFSIRHQDVEALSCLLPEFMQLYQKSDSSQILEDYEPIRMAIQLYEQAYANQYWKARHILWWAAIEALYGNDPTTAKARIYAFFGDKDLTAGYDCSIYEKGDIPPIYGTGYSGDHTLGEMLPLIYDVRNLSAHGQRVSDPHFTQVPHPFGDTVILIDVLAEAATYIIRKTVIEILRRGLRDRLKDRNTRDEFWLLEYGLNGKQSKKRLRGLASSRPLVDDGNGIAATSNL